ncbi:MAG: amidase, partial [Sediminibacterium sp.]|nr:amidase [Sediminibacterium sp.]
MQVRILTLFLAISLTATAQDSTFNKTDLNSVAKVFDLTFTPKEIDTLFSDVKDNLYNYKSMHKLTLNNATPLSMWQTPVVSGMKFNTVQQPVKWGTTNAASLPANKNDLAFYSIEQLAYLIKNKKISSVALTRFFIERIKNFGDTLQCLISLTENLALEQAKQADAEIAAGKYKGLLHGIPYGLKDLFAVKGTKTVLVAKFTLGALAMGDYWYGGRTKNPWNLKYGSSGSSAGSTAATVAGLVPFAIGTETWGSIVSPSTTCGATGLRPTFGTISRSGAMALSYSLDKVGPICRSAADAAVVYYYLHGTDGKDLSAVNMPFNYDAVKPIKNYKIAYAKNYFDKIKDTTRAEWLALKVFEKMGATLIPVNFPDSGVYKFNIMDVIIGVECAAQFDDLTRSNQDDVLTRQTKNDWPNQFRTARFVPAVEYVNAQRHRYVLMKDVNEAMAPSDAIICPSRGDSNQSAITNLTGNPVVCVPVGFDK